MLVLAIAPAAHGHAWSTPQAIGTSPVPNPDEWWLAPTPDLRAAASTRGDLIVAWTSTSADTVTVHAARAAPGEPFGPAEVLTTAPRPTQTSWGGIVLDDVVIGETGRAGVLLGRGGSPEAELALAVAGAPFGDPVPLGSYDAAVAAEPGGAVLALTVAGGAATVRRWGLGADGVTVASEPMSGHSSSLVATPAQLVLAAVSDGVTAVKRLNRLTGALEREETVAGSEGRVVAGPGGHVAVTASDDQLHLWAASGQPGGALAPLQDLSGRRLTGEYPPVVAPDGTVAVGWGGTEWVDTWESLLLAMGPAGTPLQRVASPPVTHHTWGRIPLAFDAGSRLIAMASALKDGGEFYADGRVAVAARIAGAWCVPEVLSEDAPHRGVNDLAFDGQGGGVAAWRDRATQEVRISRYAARDDCPPHAPPPDSPGPPMPPHVVAQLEEEDRRRQEQEQAQAPAPAPALRRTPPAERPGLVVPSTAAVKPSGALSLRMRCASPTACRGTFALRSGPRTWATRRIALRAGANGTVALRLNKAGRRGLSRHRSVRVTALTRLRGQAPARRSITLRRAR